MSELEAIFQKYAEEYAKPYDYTIDALNFEAFKSALTEVLKLVEVTDEEIEGRDPDSARFRIGAKWSRDLQKQKLKKLIG